MEVAVFAGLKCPVGRKVDVFAGLNSSSKSGSSLFYCLSYTCLSSSSKFGNSLFNCCTRATRHSSNKLPNMRLQATTLSHSLAAFLFSSTLVGAKLYGPNDWDYCRNIGDPDDTHFMPCPGHTGCAQVGPIINFGPYYHRSGVTICFVSLLLLLQPCACRARGRRSMLTLYRMAPKLVIHAIRTASLRYSIF